MSANPITAARKLAARLRQLADDLDDRLAAIEQAKRRRAVPRRPAARVVTGLRLVAGYAGVLLNRLDLVRDLPDEAPVEAPPVEPVEAPVEEQHQ